MTSLQTEIDRMESLVVALSARVDELESTLNYMARTFEHCFEQRADTAFSSNGSSQLNGAMDIDIRSVCPFITSHRPAKRVVVAWRKKHDQPKQ